LKDISNNIKTEREKYLNIKLMVKMAELFESGGLIEETIVGQGEPHMKRLIHKNNINQSINQSIIYINNNNNKKTKSEI